MVMHLLEEGGRVEQGLYDGAQKHMNRWVTKRI